jgi:predicted GTPase
MIRKVALLVLLVATAALMAHPPSEVELTFNNGSKTLAVHYTHKASDPTDHYIGTITIRLNDVVVVTQNQFSQANREGGEVSYVIVDAKPGDRISATLECNKRGRASEAITVPEE